MTRTKVTPQTATTPRRRMCARVEGLRRRGKLLARRWDFRVRVDGFAVDYGAKDLGVQEFLRGGLGDVAIEDNKVS